MRQICRLIFSTDHKCQLTPSKPAAVRQTPTAESRHVYWPSDLRSSAPRHHLSYRTSPTALKCVVNHTHTTSVLTIITSKRTCAPFSLLFCQIITQPLLAAWTTIKLRLLQADNFMGAWHYSVIFEELNQLCRYSGATLTLHCTGTWWKYQVDILKCDILHIFYVSQLPFCS